MKTEDMATNSSHLQQFSDRNAIQAAGDPQLTASEAASECISAFARAHPEVVALWALGIGFILGWRLKPW